MSLYSCSLASKKKSAKFQANKEVVSLGEVDPLPGRFCHCNMSPAADMAKKLVGVQNMVALPLRTGYYKQCQESQGPHALCFRKNPECL